MAAPWLEGFLAFLRGLQAAGVFLQAGGDGAGVEGVGVAAFARPAAGGLDGEQHIGGLGLSIGGEGVAGAEVEVQVAEDDGGQQVAAGGQVWIFPAALIIGSRSPASRTPPAPLPRPIPRR